MRRPMAAAAGKMRSVHMTRAEMAHSAAAPAMAATAAPATAATVTATTAAVATAPSAAPRDRRALASSDKLIAWYGGNRPGARSFTIACAKRAPLLADGRRLPPQDCRPNTTTLLENRFHTLVLHMRPPARDCHGAIPWACLITGSRVQ